MAEYKILSTGNIINAEQAFMDAAHPGDYTLITPDQTPAAPTIITRFAMMNRIGAGALSTLYSMIGNRPSAQMYIDELQSAEFVDLSSPATAAGLNGLVSLNVITATQMTTILSAPVQVGEQP